MTATSPLPIKEATPAQHFDLPKDEPARFVRNGILETCQCSDCAPLRGRELSEDLALADYRDKAYERLHALCGTRNDAPNWADIACILSERDELYEKLRASPLEQPTSKET